VNYKKIVSIFPFKSFIFMLHFMISLFNLIQQLNKIYFFLNKILFCFLLCFLNLTMITNLLIKASHVCNFCNTPLNVFFKYDMGLYTQFGCFCNYFHINELEIIFTHFLKIQIFCLLIKLLYYSCLSTSYQLILSSRWGSLLRLL
jgi:hypothetical protein